MSTWIGGWRRTRGWGPWKHAWASICSAHYDYDEGCRLCQKGHWFNYWSWCLGHLVYMVSPSLWRWGTNRKGTARKWLK